MFKSSICLALIILYNYFDYGATVNYSDSLTSYQPHLIPASNTNYNEEYKNNVLPDRQAQAEPNLQGNSNYQQFYREYYISPYQEQQQQRRRQEEHLQNQPTQLWSGPPIVVEDDTHEQYYAATTNVPPLFYNNNNNKNNNIVYHKDLRDHTSESQHWQQRDIVPWSQQRQPQHQLLVHHNNYGHAQQQPQQLHVANSNLRYNGISNNLEMLKRNSAPDYREHFKRYLENNPRRIKPIY